MIAKNESPFSDDELSTLVTITVVKMGLRIPHKHLIELYVQNLECKDGAAEHTGLKYYNGRKVVGRSSRVCVYGIPSKVNPEESVLLAVTIMACLAHELSHAYQYYYHIRNSKPGVHGDCHEKRAGQATEFMLKMLVCDQEAIDEIRKVVGANRKRSKTTLGGKR